MAKIKQDTEVLKIMDEYKAFISAQKRIGALISVCKPKANHPSSLYAKEEIRSESCFGNTFMTCEVRNGEKSDYSFQMVSDKFKKGVIFRYDSEGGTHKNEAPFIPLEEQSVTTPHFHKYDDKGYFLAYKTDLLNDPKQVEHLFDIDLGFPYFCQEGIIYANDDFDLPKIKVYREGCFSFEKENKDPLEGIKF